MMVYSKSRYQNGESEKINGEKENQSKYNSFIFTDSQ